MCFSIQQFRTSFFGQISFPVLKVLIQNVQNVVNPQSLNHNFPEPPHYFKFRNPGQPKPINLTPSQRERKISFAMKDIQDESVKLKRIFSDLRF